jgi:tRNA (guanine-N7-)-methyltransferase
VSVRKSARLTLAELAPNLLPLPDPLQLLDWPTVFGRSAPVELEVGCGKGLFLLNASLTQPDTDFVGIEIVRKYQLFTATRLRKRALTNAKVACGDGKLFLAKCVPPGSLRALHIYFPDPWWKKRHHKRRLFTPEFLAAAIPALELGGTLQLATDVPEYAQVMRELLTPLDTLEMLPPPDPSEPAHDMDYLTNFERKARKEGKPIERMRYRRLK